MQRGTHASHEVSVDVRIPPEVQAGGAFVISHHGQQYRVDAPVPLPLDRIMTIRLPATGNDQQYLQQQQQQQQQLYMQQQQQQQQYAAMLQHYQQLQQLQAQYMQQPPPQHAPHQQQASEWIAQQDPNSGQRFLYNVRTGECRPWAG